MRDEKEERKKQARSNKQTRQSNTAHPRQSLFLEKNELPQVGLEPTTLYTLDRALYQLSYRGSSAGWPVHVQYSQLYMYMANTLSLYTCTLSLYTCTVQSAVHVYGQHTVTVYMYTVTVYMYSTVSCTCIWPTHCHCIHVHCHCIHVQYSQLYMYMANTLSLYMCNIIVVSKTTMWGSKVNSIVGFKGQQCC